MNKLQKVWAFYLSSTFVFVLFISFVVLTLGLFGSIVFWWLGTLNGTEEIAVSGMLLTSFFFLLSILALFHKSRLTWRLLISVPVIAVMIFLVYDSVVNAIAIILNGRNLCPTCP